MTEKMAVDYCPFCCCRHVIGEHPKDGETEPQYWKRMNKIYGTRWNVPANRRAR